MTAHGVKEETFFNIDQSVINLIIKDNDTVNKFSSAFYKAKSLMPIEETNDLSIELTDSSQDSIQELVGDGIVLNVDEVFQNNCFGYCLLITSSLQ